MDDITTGSPRHQSSLLKFGRVDAQGSIRLNIREPAALSGFGNGVDLLQRENHFDDGRRKNKGLNVVACRGVMKEGMCGCVKDGVGCARPGVQVNE